MTASPACLLQSLAVAIVQPNLWSDKNPVSANEGHSFLAEFGAWLPFGFVCGRYCHGLRLPHLSWFSKGGPLRTQIPCSFVTARNFTRVVEVDHASTPPSSLRYRIPAKARSPQRVKPRSG